ncbi:hypothetical protein ACLB1Q_07275 [Escherichia coli]
MAKIERFGTLIGFAPGDQLDGDYVNAVTGARVRFALTTSAPDSFVAMAKLAVHA